MQSYFRKAINNEISKRLIFEKKYDFYDFFLEKLENSCAAETKGAVLGYGRNIFMGYLNKV